MAGCGLITPATSVQMYRCTGEQVYRCTGVQVYRCTSVQVYKCTGEQGHSELPGDSRTIFN